MGEATLTRRNRLPLDAYAVPGHAWLVTIGTADRVSRPFAAANLAEVVLDSLVEASARKGATLHLVVLMPDHAHLILSSPSNLVDLMRDVKAWSTRAAWHTGHQGALWQKSFHDRGLRGGPEFDGVVRYVLENPVRAGLVADWRDYPYVTGLLIDEPSEPRTPSS